MRSSKARRSKESNNGTSPIVEIEADSDKQRCPQCKDEVDSSPEAVAKEDWVRCEGPCKTWYHWRCVSEGGDLEAIDKWYAP